jgi:hypothetical protein
MFAISKNLSALLILMASNIAIGGPQSEPSEECTTDGECIREIGVHAKTIFEKCETDRVTIAWNRRYEDAYLISCDCRCTSHDNTGWIVSNTKGASSLIITRAVLGKSATVAQIKSEPDAIKDIMSSFPLCEKPVRSELTHSVFVTLIKSPTGEEDPPYCFSPAYIVKGPKGLELRPGNGDAKDEVLSEGTEEQEQLSHEIQHIIDDIRREQPAETKGKQL